MSPQTNTIPDWAIRAAHKAYETPIRDDASLVSLVPGYVSDDVFLCIAKSIHDAVMAERERDKSQSIISAPIGQQLLVWEPMYGWLIATRSPFDHVWRLKSSGNHWMDKPAEVEFTHWVSLPAKSKLRPNCLQPELCRSGTRDHCYSCRKAMEREDAA